ncbi:MAG: hypothetical protein NZ889_01750 [Candidatus Pacearchaeota archaeon]|nr:hypothetical protein [Candidatus Pacearchaeota archaeon]
MEKQIFIFLIVFSVLLLGALIPACAPKGPVFNTTALQLSFVPDAPPKEVNYGVAFPIYVEVKNSGGYDIPPGAANFYLTGIGENLLNIRKKLTNRGALTKKTPLQPGSSEVLNFADSAQVAHRFPNPFNLTFKIVSCYSYATTTQTTICVGKKDCPAIPLAGNKITTGSNTAAPIQITELKEQVMGNKLYILFKVQNKGTGEVYLPTTDCDKIEAEDIAEKLKRNRIAIVVRAEGFLCNLQSSEPPYVTVRSLEGTTQEGYTVVCEKTIGTESYVMPIEIILGYKYRESITKTITVLP